MTRIRNEMRVYISSKFFRFREKIFTIVKFHGIFREGDIGDKQWYRNIYMNRGVNLAGGNSALNYKEIKKWRHKFLKAVSLNVTSQDGFSISKLNSHGGTHDMDLYTNTCAHWLKYVTQCMYTLCPCHLYALLPPPPLSTHILTITK